MSGHGILKYFCYIFNKKDPPPEDKELPGPSGPLLKVLPSLSIASCNAEVIKIMKQAKQFVTKSRYTSKRGNRTQLWSRKMNTFLATT